MVGFSEIKYSSFPVNPEANKLLIADYISSFYPEDLRPINITLNKLKEMSPREGYISVLGQDQYDCLNQAFDPIDRVEQRISIKIGFVHYTTDKDQEITQKPEIYFVKGEFLTGYFGKNTISFEAYLHLTSNPIENITSEIKINTNNSKGLLIVESVHDNFIANASLTVKLEESIPFIGNKNAYILSDLEFSLDAANKNNNLIVENESINKKKCGFHIDSNSNVNMASTTWFAFWFLILSLIRAIVIYSFPLRDLERYVNIRYNLNRPGYELNQQLPEKSKLLAFIARVINSPYRLLIFCTCIVECIIIMNCPTDTWIAFFIINICRIVSLFKIVYEFPSVFRSFQQLMSLSHLSTNTKDIISAVSLVIIFFQLDSVLLVKYLGYLYILRNSNWLMLAITNSCNKNRFCPSGAMIIFGWLSNNFIFLYTYWYNVMGIEIDDIPVFKGILYQIITCILLIFQYNYGSRFFIPKKWRSYAYVYERCIIDDFDVSKLPEEEWPDCDYCLTKLHLQEVNADEHKHKNTKNKLNGKYMKAPDGRNFHEHCLRLNVIARPFELGFENYPQIENYDD